jgi:hypothetical protein
MKKSWLAFFSLLIILVFILYMIYDTVRSDNYAEPEQTAAVPEYPDQWNLTSAFASEEGKLTSVAVSGKGTIILGGDSFLSSYDSSMKEKWTIKTDARVTALCAKGDTLLAAEGEIVYLFNSDGKKVEEWGPFEENAIITSVASKGSLVAFADAGNRMVFVLSGDGRVRSMIGQSGDEFIIPSPYFDVAFGGNNEIYVANPGKRRIETRSIDGKLVSFFGTAGLAPDAFCGCCNPSHFTMLPDGFLTAEKGINRIKVLNGDGAFREFVSTDENFTPSVPLDVAFAGGKIYAANPADSKLYVFERK